jgi:signal transduction histidine kinase/CheY-like chemotaxis protein
MVHNRLFKLKNVKETAFFIINCCLYTLAQYLLLNFINNQAVFILGTVPILLIAWRYGYKWTIITGVYVAIIQAVLYQCVFQSFTPVALAAGTAASIVITIVGIVLIHMKNLTRTVKAQMEQMKKAEAEKIELQEQLHQSQKMEALGQLAGGIAHDLNNILGGISGYSEMISKRFSHIDEKLDKYASAIYSACQRAGEMTTNLLAFARKKRFELLPVDIHSLIRNSVELLQHTVDKKILISHHLTASNFIVLGDNTQLQNSLINLALNARDAMPDGGELTFHTENIEINDHFTNVRPFQIQKGSYILIRVSDTGTGMDKETAQKAFEPFFTTKSQGKGTGLGLSMVFGTVKGHGGFIEIDSSPGNGCRMNMYLPISANSVSESCTNNTITRGEGNVLVIDDEYAIRDVIAEMLNDLGYKVKTCKDGYEGIEYYRKHHNEIDLVILDLMMPEMGGFDCFKKLNDIDNSVKIIIASGYSQNGEIEKITAMGASDFIKKPFNSVTLLNTVRNALGRKE